MNNEEFNEELVREFKRLVKQMAASLKDEGEITLRRPNDFDGYHVCFEAAKGPPCFHSALYADGYFWLPDITFDRWSEQLKVSLSDFAKACKNCRTRK